MDIKFQIHIRICIMSTRSQLRSRHLVSRGAMFLISLTLNSGAAIIKMFSPFPPRPRRSLLNESKSAMGKKHRHESLRFCL